MTIGILGSGSVGVALAKGFLAEGHTVHVATRTPGGDKGASLRAELSGATVTDFASAAKAADMAVLCVNSSGLKEAVGLAGAENLDGKVVIDTTNVIKPKEHLMTYVEENGVLLDKYRAGCLTVW
jgi:predicted dinucleotide-binding enzyme